MEAPFFIMNTFHTIKQLTAKKPLMALISPDTFLSSGCTLFNCAMTDNPWCAFEQGKYYFIVGDSMSGKTYFTMALLAEATHNEVFNDYRFIHNNREDGALMNIGELFGKAVEERIEAPAYDKNNNEIHSETVESFWLDAKNKCQTGPCIYIMDSMDSLTSRAEQQKSEKLEKAISEGREEAGIMSDGKAKVNSMMARQILDVLKESGSILLITAQTRDNLGMGFAPKTRSGGKSLRFYATAEIWTSAVKSIKRKIKGKDRKIGHICRFKIEKNRHTGRQTPDIDIPLLTGYGFDDIGSCIDFLINNGHWKKKGQTIHASEFGEATTRDNLIANIEKSDDRLEILLTTVGDIWKEIIKAMIPKRKKRYE